MMTMTAAVKNILKNNTTSRFIRVLEIQKRHDDLVRRGIIQEEPPKTFGGVILPSDIKNKHIDYALGDNTR